MSHRVQNLSLLQSGDSATVLVRWRDKSGNIRNANIDITAHGDLPTIDVSVMGDHVSSLNVGAGGEMSDKTILDAQKRRIEIEHEIGNLLNGYVEEFGLLTESIEVEGIKLQKHDYPYEVRSYGVRLHVTLPTERSQPVFVGGGFGVNQ